MREEEIMASQVKNDLPLVDASAPSPVRIQLSRAKGWKMPPNTVKVDRSTIWGNPFVVGPRQTPAQAVTAFRRAVADYPWGLDFFPQHLRRQLGGKNLACWCALDQPCHADVLLELANATVSDGASSASTTDADDATRSRRRSGGMQPE